MLIQHIQYDTIEEFRSNQKEEAFEYLQLSPGTLDFRATVVSLPGVQLCWNVFGKRMRLREVYSGSTLMFGFVLDSGGGLTYRGHEFTRDYAQIQQPSCEHDYVTGDGLKTFLVYVDTELVDLMGWTLDRENIKRVARASLRALEGECRRVADWAVATRALEVGGAEEYLMRDRILARLDVALGPWLGMPGNSGKAKLSGTRDFKIVQRAETLLGEPPDLQNTAVADALAKELGVSRRKLYYAFRKWLGVGPHAYLELVRLHRLRHRLSEGRESGVTVSKAAIELGFAHLSRLSASYRRHFGELPKDTLKRN